VAARRFIEIFENAGTIVSPSGPACTWCAIITRSCSRTNRNGASGRNASPPAPMSSRVSGRRAEGGGRGRELPRPVTYHDSCHLLRGLRVSEQPRRLLRKVACLELVEMKNSDYCCGFGGAFAVKYPDISAAMVNDKINHIVNSGADTVVAATRVVCSTSPAPSAAGGCP